MAGGPAGIQVTASVLGADDVLKVIDQGADDTTNAVSIRRFFARTAGVQTTTRTRGGDRDPDAAPDPRAAAPARTRSSSTRCRSRSRCASSSRAGRKRGGCMALAEYGLMHVKLYEDITRYGHVSISYDYPVMVNEPLPDVAEPDSGVRQSEARHDAGAAAVRRGAGEADLCDPALHAGALAGFRRPSVPAAPGAACLRAVRVGQHAIWTRW